MGKVKRFTSVELEKLLVAQGFEIVSQSGSHRKWRNSAERKQVIFRLTKAGGEGECSSVPGSATAGRPSGSSIVRVARRGHGSPS